MSTTTRRTLIAGGLGASAFAPLLHGGLAAADITVPDASGTFFLKLDGIAGESQDSTHKGEIEVLDWTAGASTAIAPTNTGSGASKSKPADFVFVHHYDKASPLLFQSCCTGRHIKQATLTVRKLANDSPVDYLVITLSNLFVTTVTQVLESGTGEPLEQVHLDYGAIQISYRPMDAKGSLGPAVTAGFDFIENKAL